ncbi:2-polyprenyl-6-methoxyphenol hydroxylase [Advenella kashmirensis W13003]|uniref:2-polyprenyl-6-methoxyphenol hydroxylase n=1 Tax=Advenella kashmirensis W13003 TaxID=1424334 RepID=V8QUK0_9BURK|nr:FAD-dependent monooxygenase [Advenella kashmirensis]ETF02689.1 2-polyprenyl-6-methoxyphenol hydroxylase [Advenella kashmirensis W13003]
MSDVETEVLVVGGGPVGLALAGDLGWRKHHCMLVERSDGVVQQAKMDGVGVRTMEFCRRWGIVNNIESSAYNRAYPQDNVYLTALNGYELGRQPMPAMKDDRPPSESPQKRERCPQNMFDPILQSFALSHPTVTAHYEHKLLGFEQDGDGVTSRVLDVKSNKEITVRSRFLVGCDGGRSTVREQLGIGMQGKGVLTHTTNVIFRCPQFNDLHDKAPGYRYMFVGSHGVWATIVAINGNDQWRMSILGNATQEHHYSDEELKAFAYRAMGKAFSLEILSILRWTRIELVSDCYGKGRVYIAGDACHLTSPTGGLGMNTGIGDAVDLSWKISGCLQGWGGKGLLDSYEVERRPVAHRITRFSTSNLEVMQSVAHTEEIFAAGPTGDEARKKVGHELGEGLKKEWFSKNMHLGNRYLKSPVCIYDEPESEDENRAEYLDAVNYRPSTRVGCRAPHVWLSDGRSTLDLFGQGFVLLSDPSRIQEVERLVHAAKENGVPMTSYAMESSELMHAYEKPYVLVRPDGHVAWRGMTIPDNVNRLVAQISGH